LEFGYKKKEKKKQLDNLKCLLHIYENQYKSAPN
jgi:hypothetical protein